MLGFLESNRLKTNYFPAALPRIQKNLSTKQNTFKIEYLKRWLKICFTTFLCDKEVSWRTFASRGSLRTLCDELYARCCLLPWKPKNQKPNNELSLGLFYKSKQFPKMKYFIYKNKIKTTTITQKPPFATIFLTSEFNSKLIIYAIFICPAFLQLQ